jgi:FMN phosphatase YigB (HAD superfamily)
MQELARILDSREKRVKRPMTNQICTILFDLDGTLLDNDMDVFLPYYFGKLAARVADLVSPDRFMDCLMKGTEAMLSNSGPETNEEVFSRVFYPLVGLPREVLEPLFMEFYAADFPALQEHTRRKPEAANVVRQAFSLGCDVVVATNPLFPATAVEQRLRWAGVADFPYSLVTSFENSRAAKPNLLYFEQILATVGCPPAAALVVGDEDMDMVAAHLGCRTFLIPGSRTRLAASTPQPDYRGSLADVGELLENWAISGGG